MLFSEVTGHKKIKEVLMRTISSGKVGHAYIFEGADGIGRLDTAKAFAASLLCRSPKDGAACGVCRDCTMCRTGNHPDMRIVTNQLYDSAKKTTDVLVDTVRSMKREIYIKPYSAERKVYILPKADTMNTFAQNSLLKVLEEPPEYCTIILIAENSNSFLPTILSRAVLLKLFPLSEEELKEYIAKKYSEIPPEKAELAARISGGSIARAAYFIEDGEAEALRDSLIKHIASLSSKRRRSIYDMAAFMRHNKEQKEFLFAVMRGFFRDLMYLSGTGDESRVINLDSLELMKELLQSANGCTARILLETVFKYEDYLSKNIGYAQAVQCLCLELWEAINGRGYRS